MSESPQDGYPQQGQPGQPGYPSGPPNYPRQQGGYPPQGGYPQPGPSQPGGYPQPGGYGAPGPYGAPAASYYGPQTGQGGYGPQGPVGGVPPQGPGKKSPALIIAIVVVAVVIVAAVGGIIMALSRDDDRQPVTTITPSQPTVPPEEPSASPQPSDDPSTPSASSSPSTSSSSDPSPGPSDPPPSGDAIDLGDGVQLTPADGWSVKKQTDSAAQLSDGENIFLGQAAKVSPSTNPGQLCSSWHKQIAEGTTGGKYQDPKDADLGTGKLTGSTCVAQVTVSSGQGTSVVYLYSLVAVRPSDGLTTISTLYFGDPDVSEQVGKDFSSMVNSMLETQAAG